MDQALMPGTVLRDRYKIIELVGQGGMGAIYKAEDLRLAGRYCAIKEVSPEPRGSPSMLAQAREQFYREASTLARLDHPNLPKVSDYFSEGDCDYLVMDFVAGQELKEIVNKARRQGGFLDEKEVLTWADQLCQALEYLHGQNPSILHRDIKPSNIKLTPAGAVKLVDFGLVKLLVPEDDGTITILQGRGTVQYTPLEQYGGDMGHTDIRSDIYSLGATLFHLLTGQPPLDAKQRFLEPDSLPLPSDLNPDISPQTERALLRAMEMHPNQRPGSISEFRAELFSQPPIALDLLSVPAADEGTWATVLRANRTLITVALTLLIVALVVTLFSPPLPATLPAGTPTPSQIEERVPSPTPR